MNRLNSLVLVALASVSLAQFNYSFPDCVGGPLKATTVCDVSRDALIRARALVQMFTDEELIQNTDNVSPGLPRLGIPPYQWWSEALVSPSTTSGYSRL